MAAAYEKYAVYGLNIKVFLKVFNPVKGDSTERYVRAVYMATTADKEVYTTTVPPSSTVAISSTPLPEQ